MLRFAVLFSVLAVFFGPTQAQACGAESDCALADGRNYRIRMPAKPISDKPGVIVFAHGYRGSAAGVMRNKSLARMANRLGVALIALDASGDDWALPGAPHPANGRNEMIYVDNVIADATTRFEIDRDRIVVSGFSAGAMLTWALACERGDDFAGFIPISGTFWAPVPNTCSRPAASIIHIHGDADRTVPLQGRPIGHSRQGVVPDALAMYVRHGEFGPAQKERIGKLSCDIRRNYAGDILEFCLFSGGHSFRTEYLSQAWGRFVKAGKL